MVEGRKIRVLVAKPGLDGHDRGCEGDRTRIERCGHGGHLHRHSPDAGDDRRASRGNLGGLAASTRDVVRAMDAAGYDTIIIETVGTGQAEVEVMRTAQTVMVVVAPGMGDEVQALKAGILEIADIFVVSKADKPEANQTAAELSMMFSLGPPRKKIAWHIPLIKTAAMKDQGICQVVDALEKHGKYLEESGMLAKRQHRQVRSELETLIQHIVMKALQANVTEEEWQTLVEDIAKRTRDPYDVGSELADRIGVKQEMIAEHASGLLQSRRDQL